MPTANWSRKFWTGPVSVVGKRVSAKDMLSAGRARPPRESLPEQPIIPSADTAVAEVADGTVPPTSKPEKDVTRHSVNESTSGSNDQATRTQRVETTSPPGTTATSLPNATSTSGPSVEETSGPGDQAPRPLVDQASSPLDVAIASPEPGGQSATSGLVPATAAPSPAAPSLLDSGSLHTPADQSLSQPVAQLPSALVDDVLSPQVAQLSSAPVDESLSRPVVQSPSGPVDSAPSAPGTSSLSELGQATSERVAQSLVERDGDGDRNKATNRLNGLVTSGRVEQLVDGLDGAPTSRLDAAWSERPDGPASLRRVAPSVAEPQPLVAEVASSDEAPTNGHAPTQKPVTKPAATRAVRATPKQPSAPALADAAPPGVGEPTGTYQRVTVFLTPAQRSWLKSTGRQLPVEGLSVSDIVRLAITRLSLDVSQGLPLVEELTALAHADAQTMAGRRNRGLPPM